MTMNSSDSFITEFSKFACKGDFESIISLCSEHPEQVIPQHIAYSLLLYFLPETLPYDQFPQVISTAQKFPIQSAESEYEYDTISETLLNYISPTLLSVGWNYCYSSFDVSANATVLLSDFTKCWIRTVDSATRSLTCIDTIDSLFPSSKFTESFNQWKIQMAQVLKTFRKYYSSHNQPWLALLDFENASPARAVPFLLQYSTPDTIARDIKMLVVPCLSYHDYQFDALWNWLGSPTPSLKHLTLIRSLVAGLGNNNLMTLDSKDSKINSIYSDINHAFVRSVLAIIYSNTGSDSDTYSCISDILNALYNMDISSSSTDDNQLEGVSETDLFGFENLVKSPITLPTEASLSLLDKFLISARILKCPLIDVVTTQLFGTQEDQKFLARKYIFGSEGSANTHDPSALWMGYDKQQWNQVYENLMWLQQGSGVLGKIQNDWIDHTLLDAALASGNFEFVKERYFSKENKSHLTLDEITSVVIDAFYMNYDAASNGNKTRGKMRLASKCLTLLNEDPSLDNNLLKLKAQSLLSATHELSMYSLYLTTDERKSKENMPLTPKQIRSYPDSMDLIKRLLELNPKAYKDLDKIVDIAQNLIFGTLVISDEETKSKMKDGEFTNSYEQFEHTYGHKISICVRKLCIEAALVELDFNSAYSLAIPYLVDDAKQQKAGSIADDSTIGMTDTFSESTNAFKLKDNIDTWASLFQIGKFVSPMWEPTQVPLTILERQLYSLSCALEICPEDHLTAVLSTWRRIEAQHRALLAQINNTGSSMPQINSSVSMTGSSNNSVGSSYLENDNDISSVAATINSTRNNTPLSAVASPSFSYAHNVKGLVGTSLSAAVSSAPSLLPTNLAKAISSKASSTLSLASAAAAGTSRSVGARSPSSLMASEFNNSNNQRNPEAFDNYNNSNERFREGGEEERQPGHKRDQLSNLLVSGLGWAIGANPR